MKLRIYTIKDTITGEMAMPFTQVNEKAMLRSAAIMANSAQENGLTQNIEDKQIWSLGTFDNLTGEIKSKVEFVQNVVDLKQTKRTKAAAAAMEELEEIR